MAIAVSSDASRFVRTANLPGRTAHTMWGWFMLTSDRNTFSGVLSIANGTDPAGQQYNYIETDAGGLAFDLYAGGTTSAMFTASLNTWYFIAMTRNGDGAGSVAAFWRALTANTLSTTTATPSGTGATTFTPGHMAFGGTAYTGEFMSGRMHAVGACDAVLSSDEILALSYLHEPHLKGIRSLNVFYPTIESVNSNATVDRSGNGRNATSTVGALADSPSLLWLPRPIYVLGAAGGASNEDADTTSGASVGSAFAASAATVASMSAGLTAGHTISAQAAAYGLMTAGVGAGFADNGSGGYPVQMAAGVTASMVADAMSDALAALIAGVDAGESWAAQAASLGQMSASLAAGAQFDGDVQGIESAAISAGTQASAQFLAAAASLAQMSAGASLTESIAAVAVTLGQLSAGASFGAVFAYLAGNPTFLSAGVSSGAVFSIAATALGAFVAGTSVSAVLAASAMTAALLSEGISLGASFVGIGGAATILPPAKATLMIDVRERVSLADVRERVSLADVRTRAFRSN